MIFKGYLIIPALHILCLSVTAQFDYPRSIEWYIQNKNDSRFEGTYWKDISNPFIEPISFLAQQEFYEFNKDQALNIRFFIPKESNKFYFLKAEELEPEVFYWMEALKRQGQAGWNEMSDWKVDSKLRKHGIPPNNLGLLVEADSMDSESFLPTYLYHSEQDSIINRYVFKVRFSRSISKGSYKIVSGKKNLNKDADIQFMKVLSRFPKVSIFSIPIKFSDLKAGTGWYTIIVNVTPYGNLRPETHSYSFFHLDPKQ